MPAFRSLWPMVVGIFLTVMPPAAGDVAPDLRPPPDAKPGGIYSAHGFQVYACVADAAGVHWVFKAPEADLVDDHGATFARHYAGPTWEAKDGSKVVGKVLASVPAPDAGAIPWLFLSATSTGSGVLAGVRFVQRINTAGGVAPAGECHGGEVRVPYTAQYAFFR